MFDEIGWFRMLKVCLIDDWLDQFVENEFGTIFPKLLMLAEIKDPNILVNFLFVWSLDDLKQVGNVELKFDWIEFWFGTIFPN